MVSRSEYHVSVSIITEKENPNSFIKMQKSSYFWRNDCMFICKNVNGDLHFSTISDLSVVGLIQDKVIADYYGST